MPVKPIIDNFDVYSYKTGMYCDYFLDVRLDIQPDNSIHSQRYGISGWNIWTTRHGKLISSNFFYYFPDTKSYYAFTYVSSMPYYANCDLWHNVCEMKPSTIF